MAGRTTTGLAAIGTAAMVAGLALGLALGSVGDDAAGARRRPPPKTLWSVIQPDGLTTSYKGLTGNTRTEGGH
jgi:hypothetical protein